ncbi:MAG: metallophosphoesterase [Terrimicrobiaceae bacterium]
MSPEEAPGSTNYRALAARMGYASLRRRLKKQALLWAKDVHQGVGVFAIEAIVPVDRFLHRLLRISRVERAGLANYLDFQCVENEVLLPSLPTAFDGFRILQLADLHCDLHVPFAAALIPRLSGLSYDFAVFTGDYHNKIAESQEQSLRLMEQIVAAVKPPRLAVLGNHDFIEKVPFLEHIGLPVLLNESLCVEREGQRLWFAGIDDPHFFQSDDMARSRASIPPEDFAILLSHSPETYREASRLGFDFLMCGHTHGGQICLPGGFPIIRNTRVPRRFLAGAWKEGDLVGYTSRGTGACGVAARFFCPPEITIHTLKCAPSFPS